jgi:hypothetical protein
MSRRFAILAALMVAVFALAGGARAADREEEEQFARLIHAAVVAKMPPQFEERTNWGQTTPIMDGVRLPNRRTRIKVGDREEWPHGAWNRLVVHLDPQKDVAVKVSDVRPSDHKTTLMRVEVTLKASVEEERQRWQKGLLLLHVNADADVVLVVTLDVDAAISFDRSKIPPALDVKPTVLRTQLDLQEFDLRRIRNRVAAVEGDLARSIGDEMKDTLRSAVKSAEPLATQKINEALKEKAKN